MAQEDRSSLISRIGTFFVLIAILVLILFVVSDVSNKTNFVYFIVALILFVLGLVFKRKGAVPTQPNKRFEGVRKWQQRQRDGRSKNDKNIKK